jgi:uncharacterized protein YbjQ (UPF0145 family)
MTGVSNDSPPADTTERPRAFGSALSINEFAALNQAGVKPLGAVMGCDLESIYVDLPTPPWQPSSRVASKTYGRRFEGDVMAIGALDGLVHDSRRRALVNLHQEAAALGANLVVGVRHIQSPATGGIWSDLAAHPQKERHRLLRYRGTLDFQLVGTAVRDPKIADSQPRLTTLSATEFCKLRAAGWRPSGVVSGCSHKFGANVLSGVSASEMSGATALWADARADAFGQAKVEMIARGAQGMIGLDVSEDHRIYEHRDGDPTVVKTWMKALLVMVSMIGTVVERAPVSAETTQPPMRILTLR